MAEKTGDKQRSVIAGKPVLRAGRIRDVQVVGVGYQPVKREWVHNAFGVFGVGLVVNGRGTYEVEGQAAKPMEPGCVFTVWPGPVFHYGATPGTTWEEHHATFIGPGVERWRAYGFLPTDGRVRQVVHVAEHVERHRELLRVMRRGGPGDADRAVVLMERWLLEMYYSRADRPELRRNDALDGSMQAVLAAVRQRLAEDVDFEKLAREHAMSYSSLRQQMKAATGLPPAKYLAQLRCDAARPLLTDTDLSVKQIAMRVGLADPYAFSRLFKRTVGLSPQHYREQAAPWRRG